MSGSDVSTSRERPDSGGKTPGECTYDLSIVIPVYRSESVLATLFEQIRSALDNSSLSFEVIFVDDAGPTDTWPILHQIATTHDNVTAIRFVQNRGQQWALLCGIKHSTGRYVVTMDDDLQHSPADILTLLNHLEANNLDVVIARFKDRQQTLFRRMASRIKARFTQVFTDSPVDLTHTSFRIMRRSIADAITGINHPQPIVGFLLTALTKKIANVDIQHHARVDGGSTQSIATLLVYFAYIAMTYSDFALHLVSFVGFVAFFLSIVTGFVYAALWYLGLVTEPGFTTIVLLISFYSGTILLSLGVIGMFVKRVLTTVSMIPQYVIRDFVRKNN